MQKSRSYGPSSNKSSMNVSGKQAPRSQFGNDNGGNRGPQNIYSGQGGASQGSFGWSSSPQDQIPWSSSSSPSPNAMPAQGMRSKGTNYSGSAMFRGQGPGGGPPAQPADRYGHAANKTRGINSPNK